MNDFKKDYYKILEVISSATADEIKLAYRRQVKKYHPDLNPNNAAYEDLIKEINEAYEVLANKDERFAYDQYLLSKKEQTKAESNSKTSNNKNKRTYTKTTTVNKEELTYVKGIIFIKYFGKQDEQEAENILRETFYKITITQTDAIIKNIHKQNLTKEFQDVFSTNKPIRLNIKQPIACKVTNQDGSVSDYKLEILDLTIPNPEIINVTKHEGDSFGTITGVFYGYLKEEIQYDEEIEVTECFGETGKTETKNENGKNYHRKEYYNTDCSKYWGNWILEVQKYRGSAYYSNRKSTSNARYSYSTNTGCLGSVGNIFGIGLGFLFFLFLIPRLIFLLPFIIILILLNLFPKIWHWVARIAFSLFGLAFISALLLSVISNWHEKKANVVVNPKPKLEKPRYTPVLDSQSDNQVIDTLISHHMSWQDYNGNTYEGNFSVSKSAFDKAHFYKENLNVSASGESNYDKIIFSLKENDKGNLGGLYSMFDSLKQANKSNEIEFAEVIVSFVQNIPYTLVLPKACDAQYYQDEFTAQYLARPDAKCDGYERYGINTPVEFMASLNGDCDTRTLFLYTILSHYGYDVALLSSAHYSHSILGINLPFEGMAYNYNDQRYVFWETTFQNAKPGILSNEISNTDYWRISLKSK